MATLFSIGEKVNQWRKEQGLTMQQLAKRCDLTAGYISQIEHDKVSPSVATLRSLAKALGCASLISSPIRSLTNRLFYRKTNGPELSFPTGSPTLDSYSTHRRNQENATFLHGHTTRRDLRGVLLTPRRGIRFCDGRGIRALCRERTIQARTSHLLLLSFVTAPMVGKRYR